MGYGFREWFACPACDEREAVSTLAHSTEIVFECYECGQISEYDIGEDVPLRSLDLEAIAEATEEGASD